MDNQELELKDPFFIIEEYGVYGFKIGKQYIAGMPMPGNDNRLWNKLKDKGIEGVFCTTDDTPQYNPSPLLMQASLKLADSVKGLNAEQLMMEEQKIRMMVARMAEEIRWGASVVSHCKGGTGRTGTLIAGTLIELGFDPELVLEKMKKVNELRGKGEHGWPELDWQIDLIRNW